MKPAARAAAALLLAATLANTANAAIVVTSDPILYWNQRMVDLVAGSPPAQTRVYAMVNIAMHDAVNAAVGGPNRSYLTGVGASGGDTRAAASQAARNVLVALDPANTAQYDTALAASLALVPDGGAKTAGIANGAAHAAAILARRASDGSANSFTYVPGTNPGNWRPTPPANAPGALAHWGDVTPFLMSSGEQFRPAPPPALGSAEYAAAYNEVKEIGSLNSLTRTADQTASALFWDAANGSPWLRIGLLVGEDETLDTLGFARSYALLTTGLADALIAGFDAKYEYALWRPVTAIRLGDTDGNAATAVDAAWQSLFPAPAHPSYLSTHSALSGAGAGILSALFGDTQGFTFTIAGDTRSFTGLQQAALDGANSRLWGGIHFRFDNDAGLATGYQIAQLAMTGQAFNRVPEPATWTMLLLGLGTIGVVARRRGVPARAGAAT
jgi:hypothetical protein